MIFLNAISLLLIIDQLGSAAQGRVTLHEGQSHEIQSRTKKIIQ